MDEKLDKLYIYCANGCRESFEGKSIRREPQEGYNVFLVEQVDGTTLRLETDMPYTLQKVVA